MNEHPGFPADTPAPDDGLRHSLEQLKDRFAAATEAAARIHATLSRGKRPTNADLDLVTEALREFDRIREEIQNVDPTEVTATSMAELSQALDHIEAAHAQARRVAPLAFVQGPHVLDDVLAEVREAAQEAPTTGLEALVDLIELSADPDAVLLADELEERVRRELPTHWQRVIRAAICGRLNLPPSPTHHTPASAPAPAPAPINPPGDEAPAELANPAEPAESATLADQAQPVGLEDPENLANHLEHVEPAEPTDLAEPTEPAELTDRVEPGGLGEPADRAEPDQVELAAGAEYVRSGEVGGANDLLGDGGVGGEASGPNVTSPVVEAGAEISQDERLVAALDRLVEIRFGAGTARQPAEPTQLTQPAQSDSARSAQRMPPAQSSGVASGGGFVEGIQGLDEIYAVPSKAGEFEQRDYFHPYSYRAVYLDGPDRSPLTGGQVGRLMSRRDAVYLITGSPALHVERVGPALEEEAGWGHSAQVLRVGADCTFEDAVQRMRDSGDHGIVIVDLSQRSYEQAAESLKAAAVEAAQGGPGTLAVALIAPPELAPLWLAAVTGEFAGLAWTMELRRYGHPDVRQWMNDADLGYRDQAGQDLLLERTGGWPLLISKVIEEDPADRDRALERCRLWVEANPEEFARSTGVLRDASLARAWQQVMEVAPDRADELAEYLRMAGEEDGGPLSPGSLRDAGYTSSTDLINVLRLLGALERQADGTLACEPILAMVTRRLPPRP